MLAKIPINYGVFSLGKYWKSVEPYFVPVSCKLAATQKQEREETEAVSAMALLSVDVEQSFPQEPGRYVQILPLQVTNLPVLALFSGKKNVEKQTFEREKKVQGLLALVVLDNFGTTRKNSPLSALPLNF